MSKLLQITFTIVTTFSLLFSLNGITTSALTANENHHVFVDKNCGLVFRFVKIIDQTNNTKSEVWDFTEMAKEDFSSSDYTQYIPIKSYIGIFSEPGNPVNRGEMAVFVDKARKV